MPLTDDQVELFAIRAAKGNNGGEWATHYADEHKEFWRNFVRSITTTIEETACGNIASDEILEPRQGGGGVAKVDYIRCDRCDCKIVYDADDRIADAINALGLGNLPTFCPECIALTGLSYQYSSSEDRAGVSPSEARAGSEAWTDKP